MSVSALVWSVQCQVAWIGNSTNFQTNSTASGHDVVDHVYKTCAMFNQDGELINVGSGCVGTLVEYMLMAMASTAQGVNVADASSGFGNVQETSFPSTRRRSPSEQAGLLERINGALQNVPRAKGILRATEIKRSDVHHSDGIATRMNVFGNSRTLSIHTNGTHATASFVNMSTSDQTKRNYLPTNYDYFTFDGVDGIKVTVHTMNGTLTAPYVGDLEKFVLAFVGLGPSLAPVESRFSASDSWIYQVCNSTASMLYGKIVAEQTPAEPDHHLAYEDLDPFGCNTDGYSLLSAENSSVIIV